MHLCSRVQASCVLTSVAAPQAQPSSSNCAASAAPVQTPRTRPSQGQLVERALQQLGPPRYPLIEIGVNLMDKAFEKARPLSGGPRLADGIWQARAPAPHGINISSACLGTGYPHLLNNSSMRCTSAGSGGGD